MLVDDILLVLKEIEKIRKQEEKNDKLAILRKKIAYNA